LSFAGADAAAPHRRCLVVLFQLRSGLTKITRRD
jgi:hypothetical protein